MEAFSWSVLIGHSVDYKSKIYRLIRRDLEIVIVCVCVCVSRHVRCDSISPTSSPENYVLAKTFNWH